MTIYFRYHIKGIESTKKWYYFKIDPDIRAFLLRRKAFFIHFLINADHFSKT